MDSKELRYIRKTIKNLDLNLEGLTVLTEIGSNYYYYLPFIAALAGAKKVYAWTRDNSYFDCEKLVDKANEEISTLNLSDVIHISSNKKPTEHIQQADIITNSGFLRPLDKEFLANCKEDVVISLMFEVWELRSKDIDIEFCKKANIKVAGVWEDHPKLTVFDSVGPLAVKLCQEAGNEVYMNKAIIWSDDAFGDVTKRYFENMNAENVILTKNKKEVLQNLPEADFIYFCSNHEDRTLISNLNKESIFTCDEILEANPNISIVHLYGDFNYQELRNCKLNVYPEQDGQAEYMSKTLTYLGMKPTLNLLIGGMKVGEEVFKNNITNLSQLI